MEADTVYTRQLAFDLQYRHVTALVVYVVVQAAAAKGEHCCGAEVARFVG
jgi:hypothetical protein